MPKGTRVHQSLARRPDPPGRRRVAGGRALCGTRKQQSRPCWRWTRAAATWHCIVWQLARPSGDRRRLRGARGACWLRSEQAGPGASAELELAGSRQSGQLQLDSCLVVGCRARVALCLHSRGLCVKKNSAASGGWGGHERSCVREPSSGWAPASGRKQRG